MEVCYGWCYCLLLLSPPPPGFGFWVCVFGGGVLGDLWGTIGPLVFMSASSLY